MIDWEALKAANAPLNAFVDWDKRATGGDGALAGLTIGIKSNIAVAGLPWTAGMELFQDRIATRDAQVVVKLRAAGATILGTLNMDEAALGAKTDNPWFGDTQNPHRIGWTPGGSSGGSGAAVGAGLCDAALGTDTMGSVRIPAAYCGVYGFKPASGTVSEEGLVLCEPSLDAIGPLARDLDTLERVWAAIAEAGPRLRGRGDEEREPVTPDLIRGPASVAGLGDTECDADVLSIYERSKAIVAATTAIDLPHPLSRVRFAGFIKTARSLSTVFADADGAKLSERFKRLIAYGPRRSDADWAEDRRILAESAEAVTAAVARHGSILLPTSPSAAFPHSQDAPANQADFTCLANVAGLPALSIPAGWSADAMPIGMQLIGQAGRESALFALARRLDAALNAYRRPAHFFEGEA